jgi:uncharacterized protein (TIGR02145 family)
MSRILLLFFLLVLACKKDKPNDLQNNEPPLAPKELSATLVSISEIRLSWIDKSTDEKGFKIERKTANSEFSTLSVVGTDTSSYIDKGLSPNTTYTYRVLSFNNLGNSKSYSNEVSLLTVSLPILTTLSISDTSYTTAKSGGDITSDGGLAITERGLVWSTQTNPTIDLQSKLISGNGTGEFKIDIPSLLPGTSYYVRSFAKNSQGVGYGNELLFKTKSLTLPIVETNIISSITETGAISGGNVVADGGSPIISRGIVWSPTKPIESLLDTKTQNGSGLGSFTSALNTLQPNTPYYVRAYAINSQGIAFGEMLNFTTSSFFSSGNGVTDIEGNKYKTVIIGDQEWMAENLKTTKLQNGDALLNGGITSNWRNYCTSDISAYADYNGSTTLGEQYGRLYNFFAVNDTRKLCPVGWRIPSLNDWNILESRLGVSDAPIKLKSTQGWNPQQFNGNNFSGLNVLPAGTKSFSGDGGINFSVVFWTSTESLPRLQFPKAFFIVMVSESPTLSKPVYDNFTGGSVRCIKEK